MFIHICILLNCVILRQLQITIFGVCGFHRCRIPPLLLLVRIPVGVRPFVLVFHSYSGTPYYSTLLSPGLVPT
jgi:hypothetical protein